MTATRKSDLIDITCQLHHETERAILVSDDGNRDEAVWIPLSQCEVLRKRSGVVEVTMPIWMAQEKGLL